MCRWSVQSLYGKEIVQHHVSQQKLSVSLGGTVRLSVCTAEEEAPESSQPGWAGQLRLWCQCDCVVFFLFVLFFLMMDDHGMTQYLRHVQQDIIHFLCLVPQDDFVGRRSISSSSVATSLMDDTSPESTVGKKSTKKICYIVIILSIKLLL